MYSKQKKVEKIELCLANCGLTASQIMEFILIAGFYSVCKNPLDYWDLSTNPAVELKEKINRIKKAASLDCISDRVAILESLAKNRGEYENLVQKIYSLGKIALRIEAMNKKTAFFVLDSPEEIERYCDSKNNAFLGNKKRIKQLCVPNSICLISDELVWGLEDVIKNIGLKVRYPIFDNLSIADVLEAEGFSEDDILRYFSELGIAAIYEKPLQFWFYNELPANLQITDLISFKIIKENFTSLKYEEIIESLAGASIANKKRLCSVAANAGRYYLCAKIFNFNTDT